MLGCYLLKNLHIPLKRSHKNKSFGTKIITLGCPMCTSYDQIYPGFACPLQL